MDFRLTEDQERFRTEVQEFLRLELTDEVKDEYETFAYAGLGPKSKMFHKKVAERGWVGLGWPSEFGGSAADYMKRFVLAEEFAFAAAPSTGAGPGIVAPCLMLYGTDSQQQRFIDGIRNADIFFGLGYTEPNSGSDLASLALSAVRDGDNYILNGQKVFNTETHVADYIWLAARTNTEVPKHKGVSVFIVDAKSEGITLSPLVINDDGRTNLVTYDNVEVPVENLVGEADQGWHYLRTALDLERVATMGHLLREWQRFLELAACTELSAGQRLEVASLAIDVEACRSLMYFIAWERSQNRIPNHQASIFKLWQSELDQRLAQAGTLILGEEAMLMPSEADAPFNGRFERSYRTAVRKTIVAGTSEIQRNIIATRGLGLPRS